jgi:hypothetical protein
VHAHGTQRQRVSADHAVQAVSGLKAMIRELWLVRIGCVLHAHGRRRQRVIMADGVQAACIALGELWTGL